MDPRRSTAKDGIAPDARGAWGAKKSDLVVIRAPAPHSRRMKMEPLASDRCSGSPRPGACLVGRGLRLRVSAGLRPVFPCAGACSVVVWVCTDGVC